MQFAIPRPRLLRMVAATALLLGAAACGGDDQADETSTTRPEDVDQSSSMTATEEEQSSFNAPEDSALTEAQVNAFLRTTLTQFDLIRSESPALHQRIARMETREQKGGTMGDLRNVAEAANLMAEIGNLIGGSYVRSARSLGYNPAEMDWVRERMAEVSVHLAMAPLYQSTVEQAQALRQQADQYRGQPGFTDEQIQEMIRNSEQMERDAQAQMSTSGAVGRNVEVLRLARPNVTNHMWAAVALVGGPGGLLALQGLGDPADTTAQRQLTEWRQIYADALANRVTPGMEADKSPGEARPQLTPQPAGSN